jgi:hypothetical protein
LMRALGGGFTPDADTARLAQQDAKKDIQP